MNAGEWIGLVTAILGGLGGLATIVFTQLRALRKEAQEHQEKMAERGRLSAEVAQAQRAEMNQSIVALRKDVAKAATGAYSVEDIKALIPPEGDPE